MAAELSMMRYNLFPNIQGLDKIMEHCRYCTHVFINVVFHLLLASICPDSFCKGLIHANSMV